MSASEVKTSEEAPPSTPARKLRIASLDWARGWMLVASVSVNSLLITPAWFDHAPWQGVHPIDIIFPVFVTLSGCGLAFALRNRVAVKPMLRRFIVLMLVGLVYNAILAWSVDVFTWRITGVLQLYAVLVVIVGLLHLVTKTWQGWAIITVLLAFAHTTILSVYATGCPSGVLTRACNPSGPVDSLLLTPAHMYAKGAAGHDPEGVIVILGALISAAAGATVGHLLLALARKQQETGRGPENAVLPLIAVAVSFLILIQVLRLSVPLWLGVQLPMMKRLWTAPFALTIAAGTTILLLIGHLLLDRSNVPPPITKLSHPLISLGRNSLLVYFGSHVLMSLLNRPIGAHPSIGQAFAALWPSVLWAQVAWTATLLLFWTLLAVWLHNRKIYVKP